MAYAAKHSLGMDFKHTGRTFRLAKTENRDTWFIAMHPKPSVTCEDSRPHHNVTQGLAADNGMLKERATCLAAYITDTFKDPMLIGHWVEPSWRPGSKYSQTLPQTAWAVFQLPRPVLSNARVVRLVATALRRFILDHK